MQQETINLEPILKNFFSDEMDKLLISVPARVESVQKLEEGYIDVKPLYMPRFLDGVYSELPVIYCVPLMTPDFNHSGLIVPPKEGDTVQLWFAQCNIDPFKGGSVEPYKTVFKRTFNINDAVAVIGLKPFEFSNFKLDRHKKDYETGDVSLFNNLGEDTESKINLKKDGGIKIISESSMNMVSKQRSSIDTPALKTSGNISSQTGATGTFTSTTGQIITVANGIVVSIA